MNTSKMQQPMNLKHQSNIPAGSIHPLPWRSACLKAPLYGCAGAVNSPLPPGL